LDILFEKTTESANIPNTTSEWFIDKIKKKTKMKLDSTHSVSFYSIGFQFSQNVLLKHEIG